MLLDLSNNAEKTVDDVVSEHLDKKIFYFGELHGKKDVLEVQKALLAALAQHGSLILGLEMFNVRQQPLIDAYLNGELSREELVQRYQEGPEGFPLDHYGQLLDLARQLRVPVKALIIPRDVAALVVRQGVTALERHSNVFSMANDYIPGSKEHEEYFVSLIQGSMPMMKTGFSPDRFFQAQVVKDSSMARNIVNALKDAEWKARMLVITGSGHVDYGFGVPERVATMLKDEGITMKSVSITTRTWKEPVPPRKNGRMAADYLCRSRE